MVSWAPCMPRGHQEVGLYIQMYVFLCEYGCMPMTVGALSEAVLMLLWQLFSV